MKRFLPYCFGSILLLVGISCNQTITPTVPGTSQVQSNAQKPARTNTFTPTPVGEVTICLASGDSGTFGTLITDTSALSTLGAGQFGQWFGADSTGDCTDIPPGAHYPANPISSTGTFAIPSNTAVISGNINFVGGSSFTLVINGNTINVTGNSIYNLDVTSFLVSGSNSYSVSTNFSNFVNQGFSSFHKCFGINYKICANVIQATPTTGPTGSPTPQTSPTNTPVPCMITSATKVVKSTSTTDTRTTIGIGEIVTLSLISGDSAVWDNISLDPVNGSILDQGDTAIFTAPLHPTSITIQATSCSGATNGSVCTITFDVVGPQSLSSGKQIFEGTVCGMPTPTPSAIGILGTKATGIGERTYFAFIVNPTNVSFSNVQFFEDIQQQVATFPNSQSVTFIAVNPTIDDENGTDFSRYKISPKQNKGADLVEFPFNSIRLLASSKGHYQNYKIITPLNNAYYDDGGNEVIFYTGETHTRLFDSKLTSQAEWNAEGGPFKGTAQGPWQSECP